MVFRVCEFDYGREKIRFVASENYMMKGPRNDTVQVDLGHNMLNRPAKLLFFFGNSHQGPLPSDHDDTIQDPGQAATERVIRVVQYALVLFYEIDTWCHPIMQRPHCRLKGRHDVASYQVLELCNIKSHERVVTDFDDDTSTYYFWDKLE